MQYEKTRYISFRTHVLLSWSKWDHILMEPLQFGVLYTPDTLKESAELIKKKNHKNLQPTDDT